MSINGFVNGFRSFGSLALPGDVFDDEDGYDCQVRRPRLLAKKTGKLLAGEHRDDKISDFRILARCFA